MLAIGELKARVLTTIQKQIPKRGDRYIQWAVPLVENEAEGILFVSRLFSDSPIKKLDQT